MATCPKRSRPNSTALPANLRASFRDLIAIFCGRGQDLKARLKRLEQSGNDLPLLRDRTDRTERGLVEFRSALAAILDRAEDKTFEIAVFGRVSSGKSSLLNAMLDTDVLPVGVTPVTAVPTRISYATATLSLSRFAEATKTFDIARLAEFATEQQNPGNSKRVTRIVVALPSRAFGRGRVRRHAGFGLARHQRNVGNARISPEMRSRRGFD